MVLGPKNSAFLPTAARAVLGRTAIYFALAAGFMAGEAASAAPAAAHQASATGAAPAHFEEFIFDLSAACFELSRPLQAGGQPMSGVPEVRVIPLAPEEGVPRSGLFKTLVRQEADIKVCPGGAVNLFFSPAHLPMVQEQQSLAHEFLVKPLCAQKKSESSYGGVVCFKSKPVSEGCQGGNGGLMMYFFSPDLGTDYEKAHPSDAGAQLLICDEVGSGH